MPSVYFDGLRLHEDGARIVFHALGEFNGTCGNCHGSALHVRSVFLDATDGAVKFLTWCSTCGRHDSLKEQYPVE